MTNRSVAAAARKSLLRRGRALLRRGQSGARRGRGDAGRLDALGEAERRELAEIHAALERIERGIFGRCDHCFGTIEPERIESVPWERYCSGCRHGAATTALETHAGA